MQHDTLSPLRIHSITYAAEGVLLFKLRSPDGDALAPVEPGAHVDVHIPGGLMRSYSLLNDEQEPRQYVIGVKRDPRSRGGSAWLHGSARAGDLVQVSAPRNNFALQENAPHSVLIAGGIGITPLWSMVQRLERLRRPWSLHYRSRTRAATPFLAQLERKHAHGCAHISLSEDGAPRLDLQAIVRQAPAGAHFYCCGPSEMLDAFRCACSDVEADRVHLEHFGAPAAPEVTTPQAGLSVRLARSGRQVEVPPGITILEALEAAGVPVTSSCREGICGACETAVMEGTPDHRDFVLSPAERDARRTMMICCSRALTPSLTLDL